VLDCPVPVHEAGAPPFSSLNLELAATPPPRQIQAPSVCVASPRQCSRTNIESLMR